jgi:hypothetical protein
MHIPNLIQLKYSKGLPAFVVYRVLYMNYNFIILISIQELFMVEYPFNVSESGFLFFKIPFYSHVPLVDARSIPFKATLKFSAHILYTPVKH